MKYFLVLILAHFFLTSCGQERSKNTVSKKNMETDIRLLPKYGNIEKTVTEKIADQQFIDNVIGQEEYKGNRRLASDELIQTGFKYFQRGDFKTAMYRFNQAYLIDSTNTNIYRGYGAVYMAQSEFEKAKEQYETGLKEHSENPHLLTDLATYYMAKYHSLRNNKPEEAQKHLDKAIALLNRSYRIDNSDQNTLFKLSASYLANNDCKNAWKFYNECRHAGGQPITAEYTKHLKEYCLEETVSK